MKTALRALLVLGLIVLALGAVLAWNSLRQASLQPPAQRASAPAFDDPQAVERLSQALQIPTISFQNPQKTPHAAFDELHALLQTGFPEVYRQLKPQRLGHSLLIHWPGQSRDKAHLLAAHLDVVPIAQPDQWQQPPFSGHIDADFVWGRGAIDDKGSALAILEAVEKLLRSGVQPQHDLYIALGEDEEIGGQRGAKRIAQRLRAQGVQLGAVLDEGLLLVPGAMIGLQPKVALIGIAEKGYLTLKMSAEKKGGHSSMPQRETAVDLLAQALVRIQKNPLPPRLSGPAAELFRWLGPEMQGAQKWALANLWLFKPLLLRQLSQKPATNALIRTTLAPTMLSASPKENVLAPQAQAVINVRVLPGDSLEMILTHLKEVIADERVKLEVHSQSFSGEASAVSETHSEFFKILSTSVRQIFPEALVAPSQVLAATDSRHYQELSRNTYRFQPFYLNEQDLDRLHGVDERVAQSAYFEAIRFYQQLILHL